MQIKSPFPFGRVVSGLDFVNRAEEKERLKSNFTNTVNTILISPRRWGKTSLVKTVSDELKAGKKSFRFCFLDLFNIRTEEEFYSEYAKEIVKATANKWEEWVDHAKLFLKSMNPKIHVKAGEEIDLEIKFDHVTIQKDFREILDLSEKLAKKKNLQLVICVDEFQNVSNFKNPTMFLQRLRASWQQHNHAVYCLYGSKRHMMTTIFEKQSSPFYKFGEVMHLDNISSKHFTPYIIRKFKKTGKEIHPEQAEYIISTVKNHSYYVQQLAHLVWIKTDVKVKDSNIEQAIDDLLMQNAMLYQRDTDSLTNTQINFLRALVDGQPLLSGVEALRKYQLGTSANVLKIKNALEKKELIDTFTRKVDFLDPVYELWFKLNFCYT